GRHTQSSHRCARVVLNIIHSFIWACRTILPHRITPSEVIVMTHIRHKPDIFNRFTTKVSSILGRAWVFIVALLVLLIWAISGLFFGFSDVWQLIINTGTTIV